MADADDEPITLSSHALDALKEFYADRDARSKQFEQLKAKAEDRTPSGGDGSASASGGTLQYPLSMEAFTEDWNESQFWYSDETANLLAKQLLDGATSETSIAVVSAPSVFVALKNIIASSPSDAARPTLTLLEHDSRFGVFGSEFVFYDFMQPVKLPAHLKGSMDRIICDPPFLSDDCQTKAALTVRWMAKSTGDSKLIVCTGERMESLVTRLYKSFGLKTTDYEPMHARGLSNEFYCYANFLSDEWNWKQQVGGR